MDFNLTLIIFIALIISLYIKYRANIRRDIKKNEKALRENFGKKSERKKFSPEEYGIISHYYKNRDRFENGKIRKHESGIIDEITWNDLNMDDIYASMNYCCSQMGDEYLYDILHRPSGDADLLRERGRVIKWFDSHEDERIAFQKAFLSIGRTGKYSLTDHLLKLDEVKEESNFLHYLCIVLGFSAIAMVFINPPVGFGMILAVTAFNVGSYFKRKGETDRYITCFSYIVWTLRALKKLMNEKYDGIDSYSSRMKESYEKIKNLEKCFFLLKSGRGLTGSLAELPLDYLRIFFHLDLIKFNIMLSEVKNKRQDIFKIVDIAGFLDAMISLAHYRRTLEIYSEPEFLTEGKSFKAKGMIHPLVERAVAADIETEMGVLVTGSNASGKSTFLRSVALAVLMGETIYTVAAVHCRFSFFRIYSSMSVTDSVIIGESYYMAEIRAMKRILDAVRDENTMPVLCFTDELLRGTNTVERVAAGAQILKSLALSNCLLFAATHDIELTYMLEKYMDNYHFSEKTDDEGISFDYRLRRGRAESRDAIRLLEMMGYDSGITRAAFDTAENFIENGVWSLSE